MKTLKTFSSSALKTCFIVKKGKKYVTVRNNELALSDMQFDAIYFETETELTTFIENATIDSRNERVIGRSYNIVPISKR